jgi:tetratricopeptide (TPR) repeat protein
MIGIRTTVFWILLLGACRAFAGTADDFEQANGLFRTGDFAGAAAAYERVLESGGPRASVYYNLGNSYQNLKQYGPAILAYERARLLTPRDPDLLANLALARKAAAAFEEPGHRPGLDAVLGFLSRDEWSRIVAGSALCLGVLAVLLGSVRFKRRGLRQAVWVAAALALLIGAAGSTILYLRRGEACRGIVLTEDATVRLSPFDRAEALGTPGPGRSVRMLGKNGAFRYVEVPGTNLRGWLSEKEVAAIIPGDCVDKAL